MNGIRKLILLLGCLAAFSAYGQPYGNEWIDYSKTYYKFKVGAEGIFRIPKSVLDGAGLSSVSGNQFVLFHDGVEVPLYVSTNGSFANGDYIEFYGRKEDGALDRELYENPLWHPDDRISMFADTASYFLSFSSQTPHLRYAATPNNIPGSPAALSYNLFTAGTDFLRTFVDGRSIVGDYFVPVSLFDNGEGYVDTLLHVSLTQTYSLATPQVVASGPNAIVRMAIIRKTFHDSASNVKVYLNNQLIADSMLKPEATQRFDLSVPASLLSANNTFQFTGTTVGGLYDSYGISFIEVSYPRGFDLGGADFYPFTLAPSSSSQYLEFSNYSGAGGNPPKLYDVSGRKWYAANTSVAGKARFYIDPSLAERKLVFYTSNSNSIASPPLAKTIQFTDYSLAANQGDYVLISHKNYEAITNGHNYVLDYKNYRSSAAGGNRNAIIADVSELYDQFAYGHDIHPLSIRRFLKFAYDTWAVKPHDVFMLGKGLLYHKYRSYLQNTALYPYAGIVPTYGDIGSDVDFVNFGSSRTQQINIGRFSAWTATEVGNYLEKVKAYEAGLKTPALPGHESELWKKQVLHIGGGKTVSEQMLLVGTLNASGQIIQDTAFGGNVTTITKSTTNPMDPVSNSRIDSLVSNGLSIITYHGHATPSGFELNLNNPEQYNSAPKQPHFIALGCDIAQVFNLTTSLRTYSERYLLSQTGGAMTMIASNNLQYPSFHANYLPQLYKSISTLNYGKTIGDHHHYAYNYLRLSDLSDFNYFHLESMILQGDPALPVFGPLKPDYHVAANRMSTIPANVTTTLDSFSLRIAAYNLGRATNDTVDIKVEHTDPGGTTVSIGNFKLYKLYNIDTIVVKVPVSKVNDLGLNKYKVTIDPLNKLDETSEANNIAVLDLFIYSDNLVPVYPQEFSIVNAQGVTLKASTLNPFRTAGRYRIEIDTTEQFNSSLKQQTVITSAGGVIKWTPTLTYKDSVVYYWRTTFDSTINGGYQWTTSSFIYLSGAGTGWNQSHYYQYLKDNFTSLDYSTDRTFRFRTGSNRITASNAVYSENGTTPWNTADFSKVMFNGVDIQRFGCQPWDGTIQIMVFDSVTNTPWRNDSTYGTSGAYASCLSGTRDLKAFEFPVWEQTGRENARHFLDSIPNGHYVLIKNIINLGKYTPSFAADWKADTLVTPGQSLYKTLHNLGFGLIDSFNQKRVFIFFRQKGNSNYPVYQYIAQTMPDTLVKEFDIQTFQTNGRMASTVIGPAKEWKQLKWRSSAKDNLPLNDHPYVRITGIDTSNIESLLYQGSSKDTSLSFIDAVRYPNLRMEWVSVDSVNLTSPQLNYWRVLFTPVPEAALNPAAHFVFEDSLQMGQMFQFSVAIENLTPIAMDSMLVRYKVIDANSNAHLLAEKRYKKLKANDTIQLALSFDPSAYPGSNVFFIEANPDGDQPEQYHPNNLGYLPFQVVTDERNPLLDVTFDGIHILDKDIVSPKPFIKISLKDDSKYLALDDTSLLQLRVRYPDESTPREIPFDGTVSKFIPAGTGGRNEAFIEYRPDFPVDGIYELSVNGKDKSGNAVAATEYRVSFEVINSSTITNILNYPNPFSTSTAFVFTLTGARVPSQFKIQILTVTGKVVREITKPELGPIHIGRNITEYKWDGKDQYGQMLGNGVYLYRVVTSIDGNGVEHRESGSDRFFKNGYGKMYIMR